MLFHDSEDESAIGLGLVAVLAVVMAAFLGIKASEVQPKAPVEQTHTDTSAPDLQRQLPAEPPSNGSPYPQPEPKKR